LMLSLSPSVISNVVTMTMTSGSQESVIITTIKETRFRTLTSTEYVRVLKPTSGAQSTQSTQGAQATQAAQGGQGTQSTQGAHCTRCAQSGQGGQGTQGDARNSGDFANSPVAPPAYLKSTSTRTVTGSSTITQTVVMAAATQDHSTPKVNGNKINAADPISSSSVARANPANNAAATGGLMQPSCTVAPAVTVTETVTVTAMPKALQHAGATVVVSLMDLDMLFNAR
jgi:hypothetical protein